MSEDVVAGPSAGALMRQAREAAGLHIDTLAANLRYGALEVFDDVDFINGAARDRS